MNGQLFPIQSKLVNVFTWSFEPDQRVISRHNGVRPSAYSKSVSPSKTPAGETPANMKLDITLNLQQSLLTEKQRLE